jgi:glutaredoxin-like protein NrdH
MTKPTITVYTTPACSQCRLTTQWLDRAGLTYRLVDLTTSPDDMAAVKGMGYSSAPVVVTDNDHWSGFRVDKLMRLVNRPEGEAA